MHEEEAPHRLRYTPALNGLRGVAVVAVVAGHTFTNLIPRTPASPVHSPVPGASLGVDVFFTLSGFLITALLLDEHADTGRIRFGQFYARRGLRLLPALVAVLFVTTTYSVFANQDVSSQLASLGPVLFYFGNWMVALGWNVSPFLSHTWSLAVEEQFYLVWPVVVALSLRSKQRTAVAMAVFGILIVSALYRITTWHEASRLLYYVNPIWRSDPLIIGALGAFLWTRDLVPWRLGRWAWAACGFLAYCVCLQNVGGAFYFLGGFAGIGLATTVIIIAVVQNDWSGSAGLGWAPLRTVGLVSYGIYLWHLPVFIAVQQQASGLPAAGRVVVAYAITTVLVVVSWFVVERPFLALKPGRSASTEPHEVAYAPSWPGRLLHIRPGVQRSLEGESSGPSA